MRLGPWPLRFINATQAWASKTLGDLWSKLAAQAESSADPSLVLSLAKSLARVGDRRFTELFDRVFRQGTLHDEGEALALGQFMLRDLADALLDVDSSRRPQSRSTGFVFRIWRLSS